MRKRILLADDSITIQKVVELTFSDGDYEVVAVNNGAKAIQKIAEMKPDVILSDIIMPEKNGYEVCEFVKSHPVYRGIPVILLTGTFEPFDPDRADKAGCDAVVTKPFESQSLIQKVEELIEQSHAAAASAAAAEAAAPAAEPESTPWAEPAPSEPEPQSQFSTARAFPPPSFSPAEEPEEPAAPRSGFLGSEPESAHPTTEMPYAGASAAGGETRAFPKMSFDQPEEKPEIERSPWDQPASGGGETRALPKVSFDEESRQSSPVEMTPPASPSPWDDAPAGGEARSFPQMSFDEMDKQAESTPPPASEVPEPSPWDEAPTGADTRSYRKMSFDDLRNAPATESTPSTPPPSPWEETPAPGGETRAFPKMTFDDLPPLPEVPSEPPSWSTPASETPSWSPAPETNIDEPEPARGFSAPSSPAYERAPEPARSFESPRAVPTPAPATAATAATPAGSDLSEEQIEKIARRVVQMLSDQVVRNIAWEVIPDLAEMVVKERIRQLESEP